jgi:hypothetical protein
MTRIIWQEIREKVSISLPGLVLHDRRLVAMSCMQWMRLMHHIMSQPGSRLDTNGLLVDSALP